MSASTSSAAAAVDNNKGSVVEFDPSLSEDERRFYAKAYPNVNLVRDRKVHCTVCKLHIGTAPAQEHVIKMHPVLRVTHCAKCHDFYNSGEFSKGEDGSELYCRWCGQGGEVYCCSNCPFVFCKSCIVKNLSRGVVADIEQNENWSCFNCAPKILWPLRAQHWALVKYIEKQKKHVLSLNLDESETRAEMMKDRSSCCRVAKAKCGNLSDSMDSVDSTSRRSASGTSTSGSVKKVHKLAPRSVSPRSQSPATKRTKPNDEVVCTPDLLSMLEPDCQITVAAKQRPTQSPMASSPKVMSIQNPNFGGASPIQCATPKNTPPPLVLRNTSVQMRPVAPSPIVRRTVVGPRTPTASGNNTPVYHTINGYRIDLNSAAQQETFRLPNGKLIQVKRQGTSSTQSAPSTPSPQPHNPWQRNVQMQTRPVQITQSPHPNPQQQYPQITIQQHAPQQHPQMVRYHNTMVGNTTVTAMHNGSPAQIQLINGSSPTPVVATVQQANAPPTPVRPVMVRNVYSDTAIGRARTQLQDQIFNAMDICMHLTGKVQTLTNSNAYKQARNYLEVKELYIHLSYLLTYAIGRFKGLQDKCLGDMRQMGFVNDADSLENGQLAAGVEYVRYGKLDDVELFSGGANSFHTQVYEYRKSLHANLEDDQKTKERPLSPLRPLGSCFKDKDKVSTTRDKAGNDGDDDVETVEVRSEKDDDDDVQAIEDDDEDESNVNSVLVDDDSNDYPPEYEDDYDMSKPGGIRDVHTSTRQKESQAIDRKLTRIVEKFPSIWCTRHPDYGNYEVTRKQWNRIAVHFKRGEDIKLRWKNVRKRFVRIENRLKAGKRFKGYFDKGTNFLVNRDLPENEWLEFDRGDDTETVSLLADNDGDDYSHKSKHGPGGDSFNDYDEEEDEENIDNNDFCDFRTCPIKPLEIKNTDMKIINFVKCNPVLWRKASDPACNKMDENTRRTLWVHLWKQLPEMSCDDLIDRWAHLYEMYKTFRLKNIKDEGTLANLEVKYSKYLATLHFLYKIDEEDLKRESFRMEDCGHMDELPERDLKLQDMPDDREFARSLVRAVSVFGTLWNPRHPEYHDIMRRERLWNEIEKKLREFKRDVKTIKLRWQLAKFSYLRLRREQRKYSKDELPKYCRNLPIDDMKFLNIY